MDDGPDPAGTRPRPSIDIPVVGDGPLRTVGNGDGGRPQAPPPNWRKVVGMSSLAGVALGIIVAAMLLAFVWNGDDDAPGIAGGPSTSAGGDDVARITTPPTLSPLPTVPPVAGRAVPARDRSLLDLVVVPTFPPIDPASPLATGSAAVGSFDLDIAIAALDADAPRRTTTHVELGAGGFQLDVELVRDPLNDRYAFSIDAGDRRTDWVVDGPTGLMYLDVSSPDDPQWLQVDGPALAGFYGFDTMGEMFQLLMRGPVRTDTIGAASVSEGQPVLLGDGTPARAYTVELPGASIPEWQLYLLGPTDRFPSSARPARLTYTVYVGEGDRIRRVVGLADLGGFPQLVVHDIDTMLVPQPVALPDPATVNTGPPRAPR